MTVENLLFCAHTLCTSYLTNTSLLVRSSVWSKQLLCLCTVKAKKANKNLQQRTSSGFITIPPLSLLTMTTDKFTRNIEGPSNILGWNWCSGLTALIVMKHFSTSTSLLITEWQTGLVESVPLLWISWLYAESTRSERLGEWEMLWNTVQMCTAVSNSQECLKVLRLVHAQKIPWSNPKSWELLDVMILLKEPHR